MSAFVECIPCQHGFHDEHHEVVQHAPKGGVGGAVCPCKGECRDRPQPSWRSLLGDGEIDPEVWRVLGIGGET